MMSEKLVQLHAAIQELKGSTPWELKTNSERALDALLEWCSEVEGDIKRNRSCENPLAPCCAYAVGRGSQ